MNASKFSLIIVGIIMASNRLLFAVDEYKRLSMERQTDNYMKNVCDSMDYKKIGRHSIMCTELNHRLASSVIIHVLRSVIDDTLNREVTIQGIVSTFIGILIVIMISNLQQRYIKFTVNESLPIINQKRIKCD